MDHLIDMPASDGAPANTSSGEPATEPLGTSAGAMDDAQRQAAEAAAFRRLVEHLRERTDVQNIDLMNLAGFCRNCLSKWYRAGAQEQGVELSYDEAREIIYDMPYPEWKAKYQK